MKILKLTFILLLTGSLFFACTSKSGNQQQNEEANGEKPSIVFILVDDLGYGDIGCFGQEKIQTPAIDQLAEEGMRFTNTYAGNAVCAPCRSTLMQGMHPGHARVRGNGYKDYREALQEGDYTVAMMLQEAGYKTGLFGKWGLALHNQYGIPNKMGFDEFYGYLNQRHAHNQYPEFLYHNTERVYFPENGTHHIYENYRGEQTYDENGICQPLGIDDPSKARYAFDVYCEKSLEFVRENKDNPFFLYLAYTPPHGVYEVPELGIYNNKEWAQSHKVYAAMITRVDTEIGKLMQLLKELNIDENTLVVFASDNGNTNGNSKDGETPTKTFFNNESPRAGQKGDILDGAFHVPGIARWPMQIKPGQTSDHIWAMWDFLPTAAEIVGVNPPENLDGISILSTLLGEKEKQKKHDFLYWEYKEEQSVRMGNWFGYKNFDGKLEIYDLEKNPMQDNDLSAEFPEIAQKINDIMKVEHTPSNVWPSPGETSEEFVQRMKKEGVPERPKNVADF
ncbi:MAG: arylsulfatase [Prolixibacteraceae bacterium]|nr:arylsulfatase [Prolixibacteraceae bacterium]MBT6765973.1 arylsulfatase [Prolixibacteraceae bacterium]MBT7000889.1 arylsulfatase [Prolixibacteraceae bacterium]MBT7397168.1 arylsulfatase [Prolixibacteraceae bacterium]